MNNAIKPSLLPAIKAICEEFDCPLEAIIAFAKKRHILPIYINENLALWAASSYCGTYESDEDFRIGFIEMSFEEPEMPLYFSIEGHYFYNNPRTRGVI